MVDWQPTNPPVPPVQQQGWFARNRALSIILGIVLVVVLCCCGAGVLAMAGEDVTSTSTDDTSTDDTTSDDAAVDPTEDPTSDETKESAPADTSSSSSSSTPETTPEETTPEETTPEATSDTEDFSTEEENAIRSAKSYLEFMPFSKQGLIDQLSSSAGDGYPEPVARTAVEHIEPDVDWDEQAVKAAESYLDFTSFSRDGLIQQLTSDAGDGFTQEQAEHAADEVGL